MRDKYLIQAINGVFKESGNGEENDSIVRTLQEINIY